MERNKNPIYHAAYLNKKKTNINLLVFFISSIVEIKKTPFCEACVARGDKSEVSKSLRSWMYKVKFQSTIGKSRKHTKILYYSCVERFSFLSFCVGENTL